MTLNYRYKCDNSQITFYIFLVQHCNLPKGSLCGRDKPYLAQLGIKVNNNDMTVQINVCTCICLDTAHIYLWTSVVSPLLSSSHHQQQTWEMGVWQYHDPSWSLWWTLHSQTHSSPTHWIPDRNLHFILSITDLKLWFLVPFNLHKDVENVHVCFMSLLMINVMLS